MKFIKLEFTPLEFETKTGASPAGPILSNQNLLRWSLKLRNCLQLCFDFIDQNLLRWSLKQEKERLLISSEPPLEFTPLEFET